MKSKHDLKPEQFNNALSQAVSFQLANKKQVQTQDESFADAYDKAFHEVPQVKYLSQAQYLQNVVLPQLQEKKGIDSEMYIFYFGIFESLMYSIKILDRDYSLRYRFTNERMLNDYYKQKVIFYESELQKYTTMEDLLTKETAQNLLTKKTLRHE